MIGKLLTQRVTLINRLGSDGRPACHLASTTVPSPDQPAGHGLDPGPTGAVTHCSHPRMKDPWRRELAQNDSSHLLSRRSIIAAGLSIAAGGAIGGFASAAHGNGTPASAGLAAPPAFDYRVENMKPGTPRTQVPTDWGSTPMLSGYLGEHASTPETRTISVFASSTLSSIHIYAYRLGHYAGLGQRLVWKSPPVAVRQQGIPVIAKDTKMVTAPWAVTTTVDTSSWPEGFYYLVLSGGAGNDHLIPLVVESESMAGRAVLVLNDCTMQAYNRWGGYSLYRGPDATNGERSYKVSFDRPYENFEEMELRNSPLVRASEAIQDASLKLAYTTESRIDAKPDLLSGASSIMFSGHSEYWSPSMRHSVEASRDEGANVVFFGANNVYWRTRMEPSSLGHSRVMVCYRLPELDPMSETHPALSTTRWRSAPHPEPESTLTGSIYGDLKVTGMFTVSDPNFFAFAGTGAKKDDTFPGLVGGETDYVHGKNDVIQVENPQGLRIFAHSPAAGTHDQHGWADSTFYAAASGSGVIDLGSLNWLQSTVDPGVPQRSRSLALRVTQNIISESGRSQLGVHAR